jgi:hypothetical protein
MTRDELRASLQIVQDDNYTLGEKSYFDWSCTSTLDDDKIAFEVGDEDGDVAQLHLTIEQMGELHHRLTVWLLNR